MSSAVMPPKGVAGFYPQLAAQGHVVLHTLLQSADPGRVRRRRDAGYQLNTGPEFDVVARPACSISTTTQSRLTPRQFEAT